MTFEEYAKNPMQSSIMSNREMYRNMYKAKWDAIKVRENGLIVYTLYKGSKDYYIHFKIPSEVVPKFYYDTIIRFMVPKGKGTVEKEKTLTNYDIQVYSNDPSFCYTFCYAFNSRKMFINDLDSKMIKACLTRKAIDKNPRNELGYVKSIYFAYLEAKSQNLFAKIKYDASAKTYTKKEILSNVTHASDKVADRQEKGAEISKREKRKLNRAKNIEKGTSQNTNNISSPNPKGFGHFKQTISNIISKPNSPNIKGFGRFNKKNRIT